MTDPVRKAFDDERAARAQLPGDTQALVVIMSDIAPGWPQPGRDLDRGGRGALGAALDVQAQLQAPASPAPD